MVQPKKTNQRLHWFRAALDESNSVMRKRLLIKNALVWSTVLVVCMHIFQGDELNKRHLKVGEPLVPSPFTNTTDDSADYTNQKETSIRFSFEYPPESKSSSTNIRKWNEKQASISNYREEVSRTDARAHKCTLRRQTKDVPEFDLNLATECLKLTSPSISLEYPEDAEEHFNEIRMALSPWSQHSTHKPHSAKGFNGPWIENHWIAHFETSYDRDTESCLSDYFGPFIPIFLPWTDHLLANHHRYPDGFLDTLRLVLRPNVPYITVSQNDEGLTGKYEFDIRVIPNLLVLSAGGYGHIPIPLLKQEEELNNGIAIQDRVIHISYVGSLKNAPKAMRRKMHESLVARNSSNFVYMYYYGNDWRQVMGNSRFSLVPRGFGRSAYHLAEVVQMGLIPIYVYMDDDDAWIPYIDLFHEIGYETNLSGLPNLISKLKELSNNDIYEKERRIEILRRSHFSYEGVLHQIEQYTKGERSDLRCQPLPLTLTGKT